jgi:hypothetical protein
LPRGKNGVGGKIPPAGARKRLAGDGLPDARAAGGGLGPPWAICFAASGVSFAHGLCAKPR